MKFLYLFLLTFIGILSLSSQGITESEIFIEDLIKEELVDSAMVTADKLVQNGEEAGLLNEAVAYYCRALVYYMQDEFDAAKVDLKKALSLCGEKYPYLAYRVRSRLAACHDQQYHQDSAKVHLDILLEQEEYGDPVSKTYTYSGVFNYHMIGKNKHLGLEYILKARDLADSIGMHKRAATFDADIGQMYRSIDLDSLALFYQNRGLQYQLDNGHLVEASYIYLDRASYYNLAGDYEQAEKDLLECLRISEIHNIPSNIANANQFLSATYTNFGRYDEAIDAIDISMEICEQYDIDICRVYAYLHYANTYHAAGNHQKAIENGNKLVSYSEELYLDQIIEGYGYLAMSYAESGQYDLAYESLDQERILKDSMFTLEKEEALGEIREEYEREKNLVEITKLKSANRIEALKRKGISYGFGLFGLLSLVIINREIKRRKKSKQLHEAELNIKELQEIKLKEEINYKNRELTTKALHLAKKNEMLEKLRTELTELSEQEGSKACVAKVVRTLRLENVIDDNWTQFMRQFTDLNPTFYKELLTRFPDLSKGELRLAALMRMNMNTKDVANMLNISDSSVKKARQRIRKKLQLDSTESLEAFILNV